MRALHLAATLLLLEACSSERVGSPFPAPVDWRSLDEQPIVDGGHEAAAAPVASTLAEGYVAALSSTGFAALTPLLDAAAHFASPGMGDARGARQVVGAHNHLFGAFDDRRVVLRRVWRTPSEQAIEWTMNGTQARDWMGVAGTNEPVSFEGLTLLWTNDRRTIADVHVYVDVAVIKGQLGVGPKDLRALPPVSVPPAGEAEVFEQTSERSYDESAHVDVVKGALDALENFRERAYVSAMADDVELYTLERETPLRGKEALRGYYKAMHKAIGQLDTAVHDAFGVEPFVVVEYSISGEQLAPIGWVRLRPDNVIHFDVVDVCEIRGGRISRIWRFDDPAQIGGELF